MSKQATPPADQIETITTTEALAAFCEQAATAPYVTVDTEFLRERTYWAQLCLIQMAIPPAGEGGKASGPSVLIDPLAEGLSLEPMYALFRNTDVVKVFHAARQDLEIFHHEAGLVPAPLFDTQVAAMVCGFGEQASYETLVKRIAKEPLDKSSRFTDWSRRPLTAAQKTYAIADVTHLRVIYEYLSEQLKETGRHVWLAEEMAVLADPQTYITDPETAWQRIRTRSSQAKFLAIVRALARWRETEAQARNIPRGRLIKDDALVEIASLKPKDEAELGRARLLMREGRKGDVAAGILAAVQEGLNDPQPPRATSEAERPPKDPALAELLRVLLKARAEAAGVAAKLIASSGDLDAFAAGLRDLPMTEGWRSQIFGDDAQALSEGKVALTAEKGTVRVVQLPDAG